MAKIHYYSERLNGIVCRRWYRCVVRHTVNQSEVTCNLCIKALARSVNKPEVYADLTADSEITR